MAPARPFTACRSFKGGVVAPLGGRLRLRRKRGGVPHGIRKGKEVVWSGLLGSGRHCQAQDFPTPGYRQRIGMLFAEVVTVWLGVRGQRPQDRGGVCIDVRQGGYRRLAAGRP